MTFEERYKKIFKAVVCGPDEIAIKNFNRLIAGDLEHVGYWIAEGDTHIIFSGKKWRMTNLTFTSDASDYTRAPRTMLVNGIEVPAAESEEPEDGAECWYPSPHAEGGVITTNWHGTESQERLLKRGVLHLSSANCLAHSSALGWTK